MSRNEIKVLIGATTDNNLVFANICLGDEQHSFTVSFDEVRPFVATNEYLKQVLEGTTECMESHVKLDLLEAYDCKFSEFEEEHFRRILNDEGVEGIIDISLYSESYKLEGLEDEIYFEACGCGQHDTRDALIPIHKNFNDLLFEYWDKFHLKKINEDERNKFKNSLHMYITQLGHESVWIENWLESIKDKL